MPQAGNALLKWAGVNQQQAVDYQALREAGIELLANTLEQHFDFAKLAAQLANFENK